MSKGFKLKKEKEMKGTIALAAILAFISPAVAQITNASHFQSILRAARPGETITVAAGAYRLNEVYLDRQKGHGGSDGNLVTIKANGEVTLVGVSRRFIVWADYVRIEGCKFQN